MATVRVLPGRDVRLLGLAAAAIIAVYAIVVAIISANVTTGQIGPPETIAAPIRLGLLFVLPAVIAAIGAVRRSAPILVASGVLCLAQAFVAFSGVTIPFAAPALLLLRLGARGDDTGPPRQAKVGGVGVVVLGFAMWVAPFTMTQTTCWVAQTGAEGAVVSRQVPETETQTLGPSDLSSGCDGGTVTVQGVALAAVFWIGAVAVAAMASSARHPPAEGTPGS